jgi:putative nucleotidyltransferase with HDIG domain
LQVSISLHQFNEHFLSSLNIGADDELILAALFHDIGQITPMDVTKDVRMELKGGSSGDVGRVGHEAIGAEYLRSFGFSDKVCRLVNSHVAAKRYFAFVSRDY